MNLFTGSRQWWTEYIIVGLILCVGLGLRVIQVDRYPINNLDDGIYYVWAGTSFWQNPLAPTSLTLFEGKNPRTFWRSQYLDSLPDKEFGFRMVQPWFDHPPLGAAIIGLPAYLLGYTAFENVPYGVVRLPAVVASIFTLLFTYLLIKELFGKKLAVITSLVLAITPYFVFAHRQSYLENILTPIFLLAVWQGYRAISGESKHRWALVIALVAAFLCGWIKLVGLVVPLLLSLWAIRQQKYKVAALFGLTLLSSVGLYMLYGLVADSEAFLFTLFNQSHRGMGWGNLSNILGNSRLAGPLFNDTLLTLGWIATLVYVITNGFFPKHSSDKDAPSYITWIFSSWLLIILLTSGELNNFIWYRYPIFPILSFGIAWLVHQLWQRPNLVSSMILALLGWSQLYVIAPTFIQKSDLRILLLIVVVVPFLLFVGKQILSQKKVLLSKAMLVHRIWLLILLLLILFTNILVVIQFPRFNCANAQCQLPTKIIVQ